MDDKRLKDESTITKTNKKSTLAEVSKRVTEVQTLLLSGYTRYYILQLATKWEVSEAQVDKYIGKANELIKEINKLSVQDNMALISANLWDTFRTAKSEKNLAEQHKVLMSIAKIKGLDLHTINHIIQDSRELESLSDSELTLILEGGKDE